jgi:hypothetical protein
VEHQFDIPRLLKLRKLTRAISEFLGGQLRAHLATLSPLLQPTVVFGEHIRSLLKHTAKGADEALAELREAYQGIYHKPPFKLQSEFSSPLAIPGGRLEITPVEYRYVAKGDGDAKNITATSPLKWVVSYSGTGPERLRELISRQADMAGTDLQLSVLHYLVLSITVAKRPDIARVLEALRFPITTARSAEFGELPMIHAACPVTTIRPPDDVIIESTEISGMSAFEEVVDVAGIAAMHDPLRHKLVELVKEQAEDLAAEISG